MAGFFTDQEELDVLFGFAEDNRRAMAHLCDAIARKPMPVGCFVGAGLSIPYGMPSWEHLLREAAAAAGCGPSADPLLDAGQYPAAAQLIADADSDGFERILAETFGRPHRAGQPEGASVFLPFLPFDTLVTTNFDSLLEDAYLLGGLVLDPVVRGADSDFEARARFEGNLPLLKIHGDYYYGRVLTQADYDRHYGHTSPLFEHLVRLFETHTFLFVGCSMTDERILEALQISAQARSHPHFAILSSSDPAYRAEMTDRLCDAGVQAIWYSDDHHYLNVALALAVTLVGNWAESGTWTGLAEVGLTFKFGTYGQERDRLRAYFDERPRSYLLRTAYCLCLVDLSVLGTTGPSLEFFNEQVALVDEAMGRVESFPEAYLARMMMNWMRFDFTAAIRDADRAIAEGLEMSSVYLMRGIIKAIDGRDLSESRADFLQAAALAPAEGDPEATALCEVYARSIQNMLGEAGAYDRLKELLESSVFERDPMRELADSTRKLNRLIHLHNRSGPLKRLGSTKWSTKSALWLLKLMGRSGFMYWWLRRGIEKERRQEQEAGREGGDR